MLVKRRKTGRPNSFVIVSKMFVGVQNPSLKKWKGENRISYAVARHFFENKQTALFQKILRKDKSKKCN